MDVLAYSAFNQQVTLNQQLIAKNSCLATKCVETVALQASAVGLSTAAVCWVQCIEPCLLREPYQSSLWSCIPDLTGATLGFKVCNTSCFNCGFCCQWTVPAGVTRARFQLWGAGGGSSVGRCCGGSPFGATGAYASVIIPVTAGDTYTLCAGCAACCRTCTNNYSLPGGRCGGCQSFVVGNGLCNFCANGGPGRMGNWMAAYGKTNTNRLSSIAAESAGSCFCCFGAFYCYSNSCATCGQIPFVPGASYFGTTTSTTSPSIVYGIRGMWPSISYDTNHYGTQCHPPVYGFPSTSCCSFCWTSSCCGNGFGAASGYMQVPGAGAFATTTFSGCTCGQCSDIGKMGMVCVTYC
jgi:hypothetical protein